MPGRSWYYGAIFKFFYTPTLLQPVTVLARGLSALLHGGTSVNSDVAAGAGSVSGEQVANFMALLLTQKLTTWRRATCSRYRSAVQPDDPSTQVLNCRGLAMPMRAR
jgi:hypothetical protein